MASDDRRNCRDAVAAKKAAGVLMLSGRAVPPADVLAERDRALAARRSPNMEVRGDPLPRRAASKAAIMSRPERVSRRGGRSITGPRFAQCVHDKPEEVVVQPLRMVLKVTNNDAQDLPSGNIIRNADRILSVLGASRC